MELAPANSCWREAGAIILKAIYNYTVEPHQRDPFVDLVDEGMQQFAAATMPGAWLVDSIPSRESLPQNREAASLILFSAIRARLDARHGFQENRATVAQDPDGPRGETFFLR